MLSTSSSSTENRIEDELIYLLPNSIGQGRLKIFKNAFEKFNLKSVDTFDYSTTKYVIAEDSLNLKVILNKILKLEEEQQQQEPTQIQNVENVMNKNAPVIIKTKWLSDCLKVKRLLPIDKYIIEKKKPKPASLPPQLEPLESRGLISSVSTDNIQSRLSKTTLEASTVAPLPPPPSRHRTYSSESESDDENTKNPIVEQSGSGTLLKGNWLCSESCPTAPVVARPILSNSIRKTTNPNQEIIDKLQEMADLYRNSNDKWRAYGYQKGISTLKRCTKPIQTYEELISLPDIGQRLADKILEIIETGGLWKLDEFQTDNDITTMNLFGQVWGTGPAAAKKWFDQGFRTLDDLRTKAKLTHNQIIGLKYYDEFLERIPREEVSEIEKVVSDAVQVLRPGVIIQTCGSYRRGKASCGDVDVLISHPDGVSHEYLFYPLVDGLKLCGFLTDDLMYSEKVDEEPGSHMKYCGVCLLPGEGRKHRRLDIIIVPYQEYACALLYFTGSTLFNRSMRHLADGMNLYLSQHRLNTGIIRNGKTKINLGTRLPTPTEESIFNYLNLPYRPPHERDH